MGNPGENTTQLVNEEGVRLPSGLLTTIFGRDEPADHFCERTLSSVAFGGISFKELVKRTEDGHCGLHEDSRLAPERAGATLLATGQTLAGGYTEERPPRRNAGARAMRPGGMSRNRRISWATVTLPAEALA